MITNTEELSKPSKLILSAHKRFVCMLIILAILISLLSVYHYYDLRNATAVEKVDELSGQRIACCVGWESDYLLTPRKDITLLRYDTNADCILGLSYGQVDAVAIDEITMNTIFERTKGLEMLPNPITSVGCTFYTSIDSDSLLDEFNRYAEEFVKSDEYKSFHDNVLSDDYRMADIPEITDGKKITVGYVPESYPESYIDFETGEPAGYGIEMVKRFAYDNGYTVEWVETSDTAAMVQLSLNQIDIAACYVSDVYREDTESGGQAHMTSAYFYVDVYLVKIKEGQKLEITGEIDY